MSVRDGFEMDTSAAEAGAFVETVNVVTCWRHPPASGAAAAGTTLSVLLETGVALQGS